MIVGVAIEKLDDSAAGHAEGLPGCFVFAADVGTVLAQMPAAIASFVSWLRLHGDTSPLRLAEGELPQVETLELVDNSGIRDQPGDRAIPFKIDRGYLSDQEVVRRLRWLDYSRADLLALLQDPTVLDLPLDESEENGWNVAQMLRHVADAEFNAYGKRVAGPWIDPTGRVTATEPADPLVRLATTRDIFKTRLGSIPIAERDRIIYPVWTHRPNEPWTLKKSLRRALEHEREHIQQLSALLYIEQQKRGPLAGG